jgi:RNA polymerase sigma-70 factor (ECF subfamily)
MCGLAEPVSLMASNTDSTDNELVRRVQEGDTRAFDALFHRHQHKVASLISRYVRDRDEVADLVQEVFIKAYRALPRFRGDSAFYTWIFRIAVNTAKNYIASRGRRASESKVDLEDAEHIDGGEALKDADSPEGELNRDRLKKVIDEAIAALPPDLRSAVTLREFDGLSYEQIADIMDCPVGTVRSRIFRAREAIDARLRPLLDP